MTVADILDSYPESPPRACENMTDQWTVEFYADEHGREPCRHWMEKLGRVERIALETAIELVLA